MGSAENNKILLATNTVCVIKIHNIDMIFAQIWKFSKAYDVTCILQWHKANIRVDLLCWNVFKDVIRSNRPYKYKSRLPSLDRFNGYFLACVLKYAWTNIERNCKGRRWGKDPRH